MPGGEKSPGRRPKENNARRARKPGPQAQKRTTPGGQKSAGRRPKENNARRAKRNVSEKSPGRRPKKNILS